MVEADSTLSCVLISENLIYVLTEFLSVFFGIIDDLITDTGQQGPEVGRVFLNIVHHANGRILKIIEDIMADLAAQGLFLHVPGGSGDHGVRNILLPKQRLSSSYRSHPWHAGPHHGYDPDP